ncbi:E3 ubiquitin-protein ligase RHF2A-like [Vicia villosa]|uniref:E3 ubiquitin-protein ligase RHF2A-like n=1 Tax=Vicia villosa TaxID=3911 RepID=UPI00273B5BCC|nr:E3 ubiquitin-protein ligase RHF2A-like [Vicia villosa]
MENKAENHMTSAAAFVEGGIQESSDDACSICLEEFNDNDPSTITFCRHEFHLQCVLEWCQRSSQCPMCWQPISLKDPTGQELFEGVEQERKWRETPSRNVDTFHHPSIGNSGFQSLRMEERILQNLAIVASIERRHRLAQMEGREIQQLDHDHDHDHDQFLLFSNQQVAPSSIFGLGVERGDNPNAIHMSSQSNQITSNEDEPLQQTQQYQNESSKTSRSDTTGLEIQSFSDTLRSKFNALSMRYKESISKGTKDWKERLFSRSSCMSEHGLDARKKINPGIASVSQSMNNRVVDTSFSNHLQDSSMVNSRKINRAETKGEDSSCNNNRTSASSTISHSN